MKNILENAIDVLKYQTMNKIITNSKYFLKQLIIIKNGHTGESIEMSANKKAAIVSFGYLVNSNIECQNDFVIQFYRNPMLRLIKHLELIDEQPITLQFSDSELFNVKICEMIV